MPDLEGFTLTVTLIHGHQRTNGVLHLRHEDHSGDDIGLVGGLLVQRHDVAVEDGVVHLALLAAQAGDIGDHAVNISKVAQELHEKSRTFSEAAKYELDVLEQALVEITDLTVNSFVDEDLNTAATVEPLRELIGILCNDLKMRHIKRLRNGQCDLNTGFAFNDLLTNYERIAAHCSNIAVAILELDSSNFDMHEYTKSVRKLKDDRYLSAFEKYEEKYDINGYRPKEETEKRIIEPKEK